MCKIFDAIDPVRLAETAEKEDFPLTHLVMRLLMHRAPRVMKVQGCYGPQVAGTGQSILAGCALSTSLARAHVLPLIRGVGSDPWCRLSQHVDDLSQAITANTEQQAVSRAVRYGTAPA